MGDEQRVSWQELLAQSRDDFEAGTDFTLAVTFQYNDFHLPAYRSKCNSSGHTIGYIQLARADRTFETKSRTYRG
jgi:hypothetical protein